MVLLHYPDAPGYQQLQDKNISMREYFFNTIILTIHWVLVHFPDNLCRGQKVQSEQLQAVDWKNWLASNSGTFDSRSTSEETQLSFESWLAMTVGAELKTGGGGFLLCQVSTKSWVVVKKKCGTAGAANLNDEDPTLQRLTEAREMLGTLVFLELNWI